MKNMQIMGFLHALRLRHIDLLSEMPIEKGIVDMKFANSPLVIECIAKHIIDGDEIYQRLENTLPSFGKNIGLPSEANVLENLPK